MPRYRTLDTFFPLFDPLVTGIPEGVGFIAVEERLSLGHVTDVGRLVE